MPGRPRIGMPAYNRRLKAWVVYYSKQKEPRILKAQNLDEAIRELSESPATGAGSNTSKAWSIQPGKTDTFSFSDHDGSNPLQSWLSANQPESSTKVTERDGTVDVPSVDSPSLFTSVSNSPQAKPAESPQNTPTTNAVPGSLTLSAAEKSRYHSLLSGIVTRANVVTVGLAIKTFGRRIPGEPSEDDIKLLEKAWEAQLAIWFADTEIPPYALILGASLGMGLGMWAEGEPLPPKAPKHGPPGSNPSDSGTA